MFSCSPTSAAPLLLSALYARAYTSIREVLSQIFKGWPDCNQVTLRASLCSNVTLIQPRVEFRFALFAKRESPLFGIWVMI